MIQKNEFRRTKYNSVVYRKIENWILYTKRLKVFNFKKIDSKRLDNYFSSKFEIHKLSSRITLLNVLICKMWLFCVHPILSLNIRNKWLLLQRIKSVCYSINLLLWSLSLFRSFYPFSMFKRRQLFCIRFKEFSKVKKYHSNVR